MTQFDISIISLSKSFSFSICAKDDPNPLFYSLMQLFTGIKTEDRYKIESLQQKDQNFENKLIDFVNQFKESDPKINRLKTNFDLILMDEHFFVLFTNEIPKDVSFDLCNYLIAQKEGKDYTVFKNEIDNDFGELRRKYDISIFGFQEKSFIGEKDKTKRICRFCKRKQPEVTFRKIAHSISEALGNKLIVTHDECDECNHLFGIGIETDLILYLDIYRNFFGVKGKNGIPTLFGDNFIMKNDGNKKITLEHYLKEGEEPNEDFNFLLRNKRMIIGLNVYKSLVKYALSVADNNCVDYFENTILWLKGKYQFPKLPKIAVLTSYDLYRDHPMLTLYQRKDEDVTFPKLVCELRFTFITFVFIIPDSNITVYSKDYFDHFWNFFKHYKEVKGWKFIDFSNPEPVKFDVKLNFKKADP